MGITLSSSVGRRVDDQQRHDVAAWKRPSISGAD
jgi:hypothetical protein